MNTTTNEQYCGSIIWLNHRGDITIAWNEENTDKMIELVKKKMKEGYVFFTTKKFDIIELEYKNSKRKSKVTTKNVDDIGNLVIPDELFDKMIKEMDDADIAKSVLNNEAQLIKRPAKSELSALKKLHTPEDVVNNNCVALRPIHGG